MLNYICIYFYLLCLYIYIAFTIEPGDAVVKTGTPVNMLCKAVTTETDTMVVTWSHNDTWITDYVNKPYSLRRDGSLYFQHFLPSYQGNYQCSAKLLPSNLQIVSRVAEIQVACKYIKCASFKLQHAFCFISKSSCSKCVCSTLPMSSSKKM